jgi:hypothetical protein
MSLADGFVAVSKHQVRWQNLRVLAVSTQQILTFFSSHRLSVENCELLLRGFDPGDTQGCPERGWDGGLLDGDRADGALSPASSRFAANAEDSVTELAEQLRDGTYRPSLLTEVVLPRGGRSRWRPLWVVAW